MTEFNHIYLMVKWHPTDPSKRKDHIKEGLFYFCKTTGENPLMYKGSGDHWKTHLKKYGKHLVDTPWYCLFTDKDEIEKFALMCSEDWDIVKSNLWANQMSENGLDGRQKGSTSPMKGRKNLGASESNRKRKGVKKGPRTEEEKQNISKSRKKGIKEGTIGLWNKGLKTGPQSDSHKANISNATKGKTKGVLKSEEHKKNMRKPQKYLFAQNVVRKAET